MNFSVNGISLMFNKIYYNILSFTYFVFIYLFIFYRNTIVLNKFAYRILSKRVL